MRTNGEPEHDEENTANSETRVPDLVVEFSAMLDNLIARFEA